MCREAAPSPNHCSLGAGGDSAGGGSPHFGEYAGGAQFVLFECCMAQRKFAGWKGRKIYGIAHAIFGSGTVGADYF